MGSAVPAHAGPPQMAAVSPPLFCRQCRLAAALALIASVTSGKESSWYILNGFDGDGPTNVTMMSLPSWDGIRLAGGQVANLKMELPGTVTIRTSNPDNTYGF